MRDKSNISMSDKAFIAPHDFIEKIKARFNLNRHQAEHLAFSSWRKFKLILVKDRETRERLRDILSEINRGKHGK
ncbi:MAG: hypothetical protein PUJ19_03075 [Campylobacteraceae bacterium]|nr:hypothetical protein [Campylobacteraceae bacterium]MDY4121492.1 hypothetical protein [Campylobacter sp.]